MGKDKRMDTFAKETFRFGTLRGFKHFEAELRGREELLVTLQLGSEPSSSIGIEPMSQSSALPPASPCNREKESPRWEDLKPSDIGLGQKVVFLIGGYAHYNCPYVWVREGHSLLGPAFEHADAMDVPVRLNTTQAWRNRAVAVWEIVAELVVAYASPSPSNPFEMRPGAVEDLPLMDALLASAGLAAFLREVHVSGTPYAPHVEPDLLRVLDFHFTRLPKAAPELASPSSSRMPSVGSVGSFSDSPASLRTPRR